MVSFKAKSSFAKITVFGDHLLKFEGRQNIDGPSPLGTAAYHNPFTFCCEFSLQEDGAVMRSQSNPYLATSTWRCL